MTRNTILLIALLLFGCDYAYRTEENLNNSLSFFVNKNVDILKSMWGREDSQLMAEDNKFVFITYYKQADFLQKNLFDKNYFLQNGCIITFKIDTNSYKIIEYRYTGKKCYGLGAVSIESNWK